MAAVKVAAWASVVMVETASAATRGGGQRPVVLCLGWWQVASAEEMAAAEAASGMAEAGAAVMVAAAAALATRRSCQGGMVGRHGSTRRVQHPPASMWSAPLFYGFDVVGYFFLPLRCGRLSEQSYSPLFATVLHPATGSVWG